MVEEKYRPNKCIDCGKSISYGCKKCQPCYHKDRIIYYGEQIRKDGKESKDKDYLSKKAWRDNNKIKDLESKKKWLKNNPEKRKEAEKKWDRNNLDKKREYIKKSAKKYPEKVKARNISKKIPLKDYCERCGSKGEKGRLERHHPDYSKPLEVITLCKCCHLEEHHGRD